MLDWLILFCCFARWSWFAVLEACVRDSYNRFCNSLFCCFSFLSCISTDSNLSKSSFVADCWEWKSLARFSSLWRKFVFSDSVCCWCEDRCNFSIVSCKAQFSAVSSETFDFKSWTAVQTSFVISYIFRSPYMCGHRQPQAWNFGVLLQFWFLLTQKQVFSVWFVFWSLVEFDCQLVLWKETYVIFHLETSSIEMEAELTEV